MFRLGFTVSLSCSFILETSFSHRISSSRYTQFLWRSVNKWWAAAFFLWTGDVPLSLWTVRWCLLFRTIVTKTAVEYAGPTRSSQMLNTALLSASWVATQKGDKSYKSETQTSTLEKCEIPFFFLLKNYFICNTRKLGYNVMILLP